MVGRLKQKIRYYCGPQGLEVHVRMNDGLTVASCCLKELVTGMSAGVKPVDEEVVVATAME